MSENSKCEYHPSWDSGACPTCRHFERSPELFCEKCRGYLKTVEKKRSWAPNEAVTGKFCPHCNDEKRFVRELLIRAFHEEFPDAAEDTERPAAATVEGKQEDDNTKQGDEWEYASKKVPSIRPDLVLDIINALRSKGPFRLPEVREDMMLVLAKYAEYDATNPQSQDLVAKMLAGIDESLMVKHVGPVSRRDPVTGVGAPADVTQYCLTDEAKKLETLGGVIRSLRSIGRRKHPGLIELASEHEELGVAKLAKLYAKQRKLGVSRKERRNRDIEVWIKFMLEYGIY